MAQKFDIFPITVVAMFAAMDGITVEEEANKLLEEEYDQSSHSH